MKNKNQRIDFTISIVMAAVAATVYFLLVKILLPTPILLNDQILFREIASGHYTGNPNGNTIYTMLIYGEILAVLYRLFSAVRWYDLFAYLVMPTGAFLFSLYISNEAKSRIFKILWPCLFTPAYYLCTALFYVQNEYTVNAGILASVGLLYFSSIVYKKKTGFYNIVGIVTAVVALLLRRNVFFMMLPFMFLLFVKSMLSGKNKKGSIRFAALLVVSVLFCMGTEIITHSSPQWKEYLAYNDARTSVFDYEGLPSDEETVKMVEENGITSIEYKGLQEEFGLVKSVDAKKFAKVSEITGLSITERIKNTDYGFVVSFWIQKMKDFIKQPIGFVALAVWGLTVFMEIIVSEEKLIKRFSNLLWGMLGLGYVLVFSFFFVFIGRFPGRVSLCLGFSMLAFYMALLIDEITRIKEEKRKPGEIIRGVFVVLGICFCAVMIKGKTQSAVSNWFWRMNYMEVSEEICNLCNDNPENLYYISKRIAPSQAAFLGSDYRLPENFLTAVYWTQNSPVHSERLERMGIINTIDAIMEKDNIYYVAYEDDDLSWLEDLTEFYGHRISLRAESSFDLSNGIVNIYHIEN